MSEIISDKSAYFLMLAGHGLFVLTGITYSLFWIFGYGPEKYANPGVGNISLIITMLAGMAAVIALFSAISGLSVELPAGLKIRYIVLLTFLFFIAVLFITQTIFHRFLTTELFLIVFWTGLETAALYTIIRAGWMNPGASIISLGVFSLAVLTGLVCYTIHYRLSGIMQFVNGLIPLAAISASMAVTALFLLLNHVPLQK